MECLTGWLGYAFPNNTICHSAHFKLHRHIEPENFAGSTIDFLSARLQGNQPTTRLDWRFLLQDKLGEDNGGGF